MTLKQVIRQLEKIALTQHNVRYAGDGDLYRDLNSDPNIKFDVFYVTQNQHQTDEYMDRYSLNLFFISRQDDTEAGNALQIQSIGKEVIENIVNIFCTDYDAEVFGTTYWQPFVQRFSDLCAGIYAIITLEVPKDSICIDE